MGPLLFIILVSVRFGKPAGAKEAERKRKEFWDREREADRTPRKDISGLDYLTIPVSTLPFHFESSVTEENTAVVTPVPLSSTLLDTLPKETRQDTWTLHKRKSTNGQKTHEENDQ